MNKEKTGLRLQQTEFEDTKRVIRIRKNIERHEHYKKPVVNSGASEG